MRAFFKYVFATMVGILLSFVLLLLFIILIVSALVSSMDSDKVVNVSSNSVLFLNLDQTILERTPNKRFENVPLIGSSEKSIGFNDIIRALKEAKTDANITCLYLHVTDPKAGKATVKEIRDALVDFKTSKKKIIAYSEIYTQDAYYLASVADKIYLNPEGALEFKGFSSQVVFFKGALEKLGIEAQIIRVGQFKSAIEPFILDKMSEPNRQQVTAYVNGLYDTFLAGISASRKISKDSLFAIANDLKIREPKDALTYKMIDGLKYKDEVIEELKSLSGKTQKEKITTITINEYADNKKSEINTSKNRIAVIYANGDINSGEGSDESIGSERISRAIRKARLDDKVKAIVLRINSPGGSALGSDVIWREVVLSRKAKPVIASFGDVAASGGYYIGCAADSIFVQPNTITGSIGVFGIIPNFQNLLNNKLGITFDMVKTGQYADIMTVTRPLTPGERLIIQNDVNRVYQSFITKVADGRKKSVSSIDSIAGGRVWVGTDAVRLGLADRLGSFNDAIASAVKKAKLKDYKIVEYPEKLDPLKELLDNSKENIETYYSKKELGEHYHLYQQVKKSMINAGLQARLPYQVIVQ
jgi:protease-4